MAWLQLVTSCALVTFAFGCGIAPEFWCDTPQTAIECQVYDSCAKFVWSVPDAAPPVKIGLYYESLCPGCKQFITTGLAPAIKAVGSIMEVDLVPYGNAHEFYNGSQWEFTCQHQEAECLGNTMETCSISLLGNFSAYWPFILCLESQPSKLFTIAGKKCASKVGIPFEPIQTCATGPQGNALEHAMALKTLALQPPHKYTPWITVNGKHTDEMQNKATSNLLKLVCDTYTGSKPAACQQLTQASSLRSFRVSNLA